MRGGSRSFLHFSRETCSDTCLRRPVRCEKPLRRRKATWESLSAMVSFRAGGCFRITVVLSRQGTCSDFLPPCFGVATSARVRFFPCCPNLQKSQRMLSEIRTWIRSSDSIDLQDVRIPVPLRAVPDSRRRPKRKREYGSVAGTIIGPSGDAVEKTTGRNGICFLLDC